MKTLQDHSLADLDWSNESTTRQLEHLLHFSRSDSAELAGLFPPSGELTDYVALKLGYEGLKSMYRARGYLDAQVFPDVSPDYESNLTSIKHQVTEGQRYHVGNLSLPSDWPAILQAGEPFHLGLLQAFLESRGLSMDSVVITPHPDSATVDISVTG